MIIILCRIHTLAEHELNKAVIPVQGQIGLAWCYANEISEIVEEVFDFWVMTGNQTDRMFLLVAIDE